MNVLNSMDTFTIGACLFIAGAFVLSWFYIAKTTTQEFAIRKKWIDQLPSVVSTLGVLGTFIGITKGLIKFDSSDLDTSIPLLLDGLKTAFFTSLVGMVGSLILNRIVSHKFDIEVKESEIQKAAKLIVETLRTNHSNLPSVLKSSHKELVTLLSDNETVKNIRVDVEQLKDDVEEIKGHIQELKDINSQIVSVLNDIKSSTASTVEELPRLRAVAVTATASISAIDNYVEELNNTLSNIDASTIEISESLDVLKSKDEEDE